MERKEVLRVSHSECSEYTQQDKLPSERPGSISPASSFPSHHFLLFSHLIPENQEEEKGTLSEPFQLQGCFLLSPSAPTCSRHVLQINGNKPLTVPWRLPLGKGIAHWKGEFCISTLVSSFYFLTFRRQPEAPNSWSWGIFHSTLWGLLGQEQNQNPEQQSLSTKRRIWVQDLGLRTASSISHVKSYWTKQR